jgi:hypothetical protein
MICLSVPARSGEWHSAVSDVTRIEKNSSGNVEVNAVVCLYQNWDVLPGALPDGDVTVHIISTIVQQASQGSCVRQARAVAECLSSCSQRVGKVHATTSVSQLQGGSPVGGDILSNKSLTIETDPGQCGRSHAHRQARRKVEPDGHDESVSPQDDRARRHPSTSEGAGWPVTVCSSGHSYGCMAGAH